MGGAIHNQEKQQSLKSAVLYNIVWDKISNTMMWHLAPQYVCFPTVWVWSKPKPFYYTMGILLALFSSNIRAFLAYMAELIRFNCNVSKSSNKIVSSL